MVLEWSEKWYCLAGLRGIVWLACMVRLVRVVRLACEVRLFVLVAVVRVVKGGLGC